jgi:hypothetical protein
MLISWSVAMSIHTEPEEVTNRKSAECDYNFQIHPRMIVNPIPMWDLNLSVKIIILFFIMVV